MGEPRAAMVVQVHPTPMKKKEDKKYIILEDFGQINEKKMAIIMEQLLSGQIKIEPNKKKH